MKQLKALLLTEGMHGMISQVEGLAKALSVEFSHKIIRLRFPWNLIPPKFTPISEIILKDKIYLTENENPDLFNKVIWFSNVTKQWTMSRLIMKRDNYDDLDISKDIKPEHQK